MSSALLIQVMVANLGEILCFNQ